MVGEGGGPGLAKSIFEKNHPLALENTWGKNAPPPSNDIVGKFCPPPLYISPPPLAINNEHFLRDNKIMYTAIACVAFLAICSHQVDNPFYFRAVA